MLSEEKRNYAPCIAVLAGPPLVGKTTLGKELAKRTNLIHLDIDEEGLALEGILGEQPRNWFENSMRMSVKYAHLHRLAGDHLIDGHPVLLTATYSHQTYEYALETVLGDTFRRFKSLIESPLQVFELDSPIENLAQRVTDRLIKGSSSNVDSVEFARALRDKFVHLSSRDVIKINTGLPIEQNIEEILESLESFRVTS